MNKLSKLKRLRLCMALGALLLTAACGGGGSGGNDRDSGAQQTTLSVAASDADGDALNYQWRVTAGKIDNRNAASTVWTLPPGPGLHFAYITVSDGRGGYAEQQYAVSSDALDIPAPTRTPITRDVPEQADNSSVTGRLRLEYRGRNFVPASGGVPVARYIYAPSVRVELRPLAGGGTMFSGVSDEAGEVQLPALPTGSYRIWCGTSLNSVLVDCSSTTLTLTVTSALNAKIPVDDHVAPGNNLRLYGHMVLTDGGVCGARNEFAGIRSVGTVQVFDGNGVAQSAQVEINRFGDYAIDAPVLANAPHKLRVRCDSLVEDLDIPTPTGGFRSQAIELSARLTNSRPRIVKMIANGPDGNVRGRMVVAEANVASNGLPGPDQFLAFKGKDTRLGACLYYQSIGAVEACSQQGDMVKPLSLDDWKRKHKLQPYGEGTPEYKATYINKMDLNLVRRMSATQSSDDNIAFYVCNSPGPEGRSQREVDEVISTALAGEREVACVAMEWSVTPGINDGEPFTKFLTFGPDGSLLLSVNLDGRGEKFMPGTCVACHGGTHYSGKFPDKFGTPASPFLGSAFLPFDTANYQFSTDNGLSKPEQQAAIKELNLLVRATEMRPASTSPATITTTITTAITRLVDGWYADGQTVLNETYLPPAWDARSTKEKTLYREVVGSSCRTCHVAFKSFDWDSFPESILGRRDAVCGGSPDLVVNASMPNALISRDRVFERVEAAGLIQEFFGCRTRLPDPAHDRR